MKRQLALAAALVATLATTAPAFAVNRTGGFAGTPSTDTNLNVTGGRNEQGNDFLSGNYVPNSQSLQGEFGKGMSLHCRFVMANPAAWSQREIDFCRTSG